MSSFDINTTNNIGFKISILGTISLDITSLEKSQVFGFDNGKSVINIVTQTILSGLGLEKIVILQSSTKARYKTIIIKDIGRIFSNSKTQKFINDIILNMPNYNYIYLFVDFFTKLFLISYFQRFSLKYSYIYKWEIWWYWLSNRLIIVATWICFSNGKKKCICLIFIIL